MAAAPLFQQAEVPFVTSGATHPELPEWVGDYFFMVPFGDDDQSYAIADYAWDELGVRDVVVWTDNSMDFTKALSKFYKGDIGNSAGLSFMKISFKRETKISLLMSQSSKIPTQMRCLLQQSRTKPE